MSIRRPVSLAASRAFWPSRPIARESWFLGTRTVAVRVTRSMVTLSAFAGPRAAATKASGSSDQGTMSTCSLASWLRMARWRTPFGPTHAPTGSSPGSVEETAILVRRPGSRAIALTCTVPALISGTSASSRRWTKARAALETRTWACLRLCWVSSMTTRTGRPGMSCSLGICSSGGMTPSALPRSTYTVPASMRSTIPVASSPLCSATSRSTLSRSRSWMWRRTACLAVGAAMRLKSSEGRVRTWSPTRLVTSSAPVLVSRVTRTSPGGLNARTYATASASSTVRSISSNGMPTSAQSAVSASARLSVDGSDCDREPARDNVIPCNVNDHRSSTPRTRGGYRNAGSVDRDELPFDHRIRRSAAVADVDPLAIEPLIVGVAAQRPLRPRRRNLEVVRSLDEPRIVEKRTGDPAHALAVLDGDRLGVVNRHTQRPSRLPRLLQGIELIAHVIERGLEQLSYRRYWPCRHVRGPWMTLPASPLSELARTFPGATFSGPKSRWWGADFGLKPLKRAGPGSPVPLTVRRCERSRQRETCCFDRSASPALTGEAGACARRRAMGLR